MFVELDEMELLEIDGGNDPIYGPDPTKRGGGWWYPGKSQYYCFH